MTINTDFINNQTICFMGLQRSGNHAIINWIASQLNMPKVYLLNAINLIDNPYISACAENTNNTMIFNNFSLDRQKESTGKLSYKDCLIYSYEDKDLLDICNIQHTDFINKCIGASKQHYNIMILRDPFNLLASRLQREYGGGRNSISVIHHMSYFIYIYKQYIKEFIGLTHIIPNNKILINFNQWISDIKYRSQICNLLNIKFTDQNFQYVPKVGGGSSFNRSQRYINDHTTLLSRYEKFVHDPSMLLLKKDEELMQMAFTLYPEITDQI